MPVVTQLFVYPVKSCGGVAVHSAQVAARGLAFDRRYMVVDGAGRFVTQRERPELALVKTTFTAQAIRLEAPGTVPLALPLTHEVGARRRVEIWDYLAEAVFHREGSAWFSGFLRGAHALVYMPENDRRSVGGGAIVSFADGYPVLLVSEASLADLNARLAEPVSMKRFRPNVIVGDTAPFDEDRWSTFTIGPVAFRGVKRCERCAIVAVDPETAERGMEPLRTLSSYRQEQGKIWFGMNLIADGTGAVTVGDPIRLPLEDEVNPRTDRPRSI